MFMASLGKVNGMPFKKVDRGRRVQEKLLNILQYARQLHRTSLAPSDCVRPRLTHSGLVEHHKTSASRFTTPRPLVRGIGICSFAKMFKIVMGACSKGSNNADGKIVYAAQEFQNLDPVPLPVLPEWSPVKAYGGYEAPLDVGKAARVDIPVIPHQLTAERHSHGCLHALHRLRAGNKAAVPRYSDFWGLGCDCFAL